jgi:hypothetical protein
MGMELGEYRMRSFMVIVVSVAAKELCLLLSHTDAQLLCFLFSRIGSDFGRVERQRREIVCR